MHKFTYICIVPDSACFLHSLPQIIEIVGRINVTSSTCVHEFSRFFWRLCRTFGKIFTNTKVEQVKDVCHTVISLCSTFIQFF